MGVKGVLPALSIGRDGAGTGPLSDLLAEPPVPGSALDGSGQHQFHPPEAKLLNRFSGAAAIQAGTVKAMADDLLHPVPAGEVGVMLIQLPLYLLRLPGRVNIGLDAHEITSFLARSSSRAAISICFS